MERVDAPPPHLHINNILCLCPKQIKYKKNKKKVNTKASLLDKHTLPAGVKHLPFKRIKLHRYKKLY
jgi:hypothetical protein